MKHLKIIPMVSLAAILLGSGVLTTVPVAIAAPSGQVQNNANEAAKQEVQRIEAEIKAGKVITREDAALRVANTAGKALGNVSGMTKSEFASVVATVVDHSRLAALFNITGAVEGYKLSASSAATATEAPLNTQIIIGAVAGADNVFMVMQSAGTFTTLALVVAIKRDSNTGN